jgi:hypothetical protein
MRAHNVLCNSYNSITVEMNRCSFRRVRFALLYVVTRSKKYITDTHNIVTCDMYASCV